MRTIFHLVQIPFVWNIACRIDSFVYGIANGFANEKEFEKAISTASIILERTLDSKDPVKIFTWWEMLMLSIKCALKLNKSKNYDHLRRYVLARGEPLQSREISTSLVNLSLWASTLSDLDGSIEICQRAIKADSDWGEPYFVMGWLILKDNPTKAVPFFQKALLYDESLIERIQSDPAINQHAEVRALLEGMSGLET